MSVKKLRLQGFSEVERDLVRKRKNSRAVEGRFLNYHEYSETYFDEVSEQ